MSDLARIEGSHHDPDQVNRLLDEVAEKYNLVAPATSCGRMPEGFEVVFSAVKIDAGDTYGVGGGSDGRGLTKAALDQIAGALGVTWVSSRRTDDGSDPHYCQWQVVGRVQNFDGTWREFSGAKEVDLRTGSPQVQALEDRAKASAAKYKREVRADGQIREMRLHIMSHAETKARLRAIRSLGIKTSYSAAELRKPFVVARLMLTGHTADPELRRLFALEQFRAGLQAQRMLYAAPAEPIETYGAPALPPPQVTAPPALPESTQAPAVPARVQPEPVDAPSPPEDKRLRIPLGKSKGRLLTEVSDECLYYWEDRLQGAETPDDRALQGGVLAEINRRGITTPAK